jgi:hypothetical protein
MHKTLTAIPLPQAAQRLNVSARVLTRLIDSGKLFAVTTLDGQTLIPLSIVEKMEKETALRDKIWNSVKKFEGETITTDEARGMINPDLLYRCLNMGYVRAIDPPNKGGRGKTRRLNKADVLYVSKLAKNGGGRGHRLFTPETIPPHAMATE